MTQHAEAVLDIGVGLELSVATTKSVIASMIALVAIAAEWAGEARLLSALADLPEPIDHAIALDWTGACADFVGLGALFTVYRRAGLAAANEAELKLKETFGLHAQSFRAPEMIHGLLALAGDRHGALIFMPRGTTAGKSTRRPFGPCQPDRGLHGGLQLRTLLKTLSGLTL